MNGLKTVLLLGLMSGLLLVGGEALAGRRGLIIGLVIAIGLNFFSYFFSDKMALAAYRAQPVTPERNPEIYRRVAPLVQNLCRRMDLPTPRRSRTNHRTPSPRVGTRNTPRWRSRPEFSA